MRAGRDTFNPEVVLAVFDHAAGVMTFPMLDNDYVYLAAARLTVFSDAEEWSVVIETFGFSPRAGLPDISLITMGSTIANVKTATELRQR